MGNRENQLYEEEINLYEYWLVIRKHLVLIFSLVLVSMVGVVLWTQTFKKSYAVTTAISLGRIEIDGKVSPVTNLADIQQILNSGSFINHIVSSLKLEEKQYLSSLRDGVEAQAKDNTENVLFTYQTSEPKVGIKIMEKLTEQLQKTYNHRVEFYRKKKDMEIKKLCEKIVGLEAVRDRVNLDIEQGKKDIEKNNNSMQITTNINHNNIQGFTMQVNYLKERINALNVDKKKVLDQCADLEKKLDSNVNPANFSSSPKSGPDTTLSGVLQASYQFQLLNLLTSNYARVQALTKEVDAAQTRILTLNLQLNNLKEALKQATLDNTKANVGIELKIQGLETKKNKEIFSEIQQVKNEEAALKSQQEMIEGITVISTPDYLNIPLKSKRSTYLGLALFASLALGTILALILEWGKQKHYPS